MDGLLRGRWAGGSETALQAVSLLDSRLGLGHFQPDQAGTMSRSSTHEITRHKLQQHASGRREPPIGGTDAQVRLQQGPAPSNEIQFLEGPADVAVP
jgi:hypothetical protein